MLQKKKVPPVLEIIRDNIVQYGNPLAMKPIENSRWLKDLDLPEKGELLFYTGGEYQLLPFIDSLVKTLTYVDPTSNIFGLLMEARKIVNKTGINSEKIYASLLAKDKERYFSINYKAAYVLKKLGYDICYNRREELYSGALLHELGFNKELKEYAPKVIQCIQKTGAKTIVCISPHAAEMFTKIYPSLVEDMDFQVKTFVELVWEKRHLLPKMHNTEPVVIHDSCRMARDMGIVDEFRDILDEVGVPYLEAYRSKKWTSCCGGPSKIIFPELSKIVAGKRVEELADTGATKALLSCPYCLSSLESGADQGKSPLILEDFVEFLYEGYVK